MTLRPSGFLFLPLALAATESAAQPPRFRGGRFMRSEPISTELHYDGGFNFCRIAFRNSPYGDGNGWSVDYPRADLNLSFRLSELTSTTVSRDVNGEGNHVVLRLTDPQLTHCPFVMMTEPGGAIFDHDGRMIVFMTHNSDFGDAFEREGENREYFDHFAADGYAVGINVILYALTH